MLRAGTASRCPVKITLGFAISCRFGHHSSGHLLAAPSMRRAMRLRVSPVFTRMTRGRADATCRETGWAAGCAGARCETGCAALAEGMAGEEIKKASAAALIRLIRIFRTSILGSQLRASRPVVLAGEGRVHLAFAR